MLVESLLPFVCGGVSACIASTAIHPIDLSKVRLQLHAILHPGVPKPSFTTLLTTMIRDEGPLAIYAGLSASLMRQAIYGTARIGLHRTFSNMALARNSDNKPLSFATKTACGMLSGSIAVCIGTPFDVALVRMQADSMKSKESRRGYKNVFDALSRVAREEGFQKLYSGLTPNVLRGMSMNVGMLSCFDQAKEMIGRHIMHETSADASITTQLGAAVVAGFTASLFSLPFDLLKSRMQDASRYKNIADATVQIFRNEGVLAFWTGFGAYYLRTAPHSIIILMTTQPLQQAYKAAFMNDTSKLGNSILHS